MVSAVLVVQVASTLLTCISSGLNLCFGFDLLYKVWLIRKHRRWRMSRSRKRSARSRTPSASAASLTASSTTSVQSRSQSLSIAVLRRLSLKPLVLSAMAALTNVIAQMAILSASWMLTLHRMRHEHFSQDSHSAQHRQMWDNPWYRMCGDISVFFWVISGLFCFSFLLSRLHTSFEGSSYAVTGRRLWIYSVWISIISVLIGLYWAVLIWPGLYKFLRRITDHNEEIIGFGTAVSIGVFINGFLAALAAEFSSRLLKLVRSHRELLRKAHHHRRRYSSVLSTIQRRPWIGSVSDSRTMSPITRYTAGSLSSGMHKMLFSTQNSHQDSLASGTVRSGGEHPSEELASAAGSTRFDTPVTDSSNNNSGIKLNECNESMPMSQRGGDANSRSEREYLKMASKMSVLISVMCVSMLICELGLVGFMYSESGVIHVASLGLMNQIGALWTTAQVFFFKFNNRHYKRVCGWCDQQVITLTMHCVD